MENLYDAAYCTPFQQSADSATRQSWQDWNNSKIIPTVGNSIYARVAYLADMVSSAVIFPFALIGTVFGTIQAAFFCSTDRATWLSDSYSLAYQKLDRFFISAVGVISPGVALHFQGRSILPLALGTGAIALASFATLRHPPIRASFQIKDLKFW